MNVDIQVPSAEDFVADDNENGVESLPTNNENLNNQEEPENPDEIKPEGDEEEQEKIKDQNVPFNKHPRWIERQNEIKSLREANRKMQEEINAAKQSSQKFEPQQLNDEQRADLKEILKSAPKHTFKQDYNTWEEAYPDILAAVAEDILHLQSVFKQRGMAQTEEQTRAQQSEREDFAFQMMEIEDSMEPQDYQEFRKFVTDELSKDQGENFNGSTFLNKMHVQFLREQINKPRQGNLKPKVVSKVVGKSKPNVTGSKGPSTEFIANNSMSEIAHSMLGDN